MPQPLSQLFGLSRRYSRSINLERDLERPDSILGYIPTQRAMEALRRILSSLTGDQPQRAWTLTGVYGTGKSAFAHYLAALCGPETSRMRHYALEISEKALPAHDYAVLDGFPSKGFFRAIVAAQREPLSHTIVRALQQGASLFWPAGRRPSVAAKLVDLEVDLSGHKSLESSQVLELVQEVTRAAKVPVFFIIDELGKSLEYAAHHQGVEDLYLLQQLAEKKSEIYVLGLLHQSFTEYGQRLATVQRNEWAKIQGRFEEIPFVESAPQMMQLMGQAITRSGSETYEYLIDHLAGEWTDCLHNFSTDLTAGILASTYPLHPVTALALPQLCLRYAQNDRSLFTFLTSFEPFSFRQFLNEAQASGERIPTLQLHQVYDYFIESVGSGFASRPQMQRWLEVQRLVEDARGREPDQIKALKTIGILNLITSTGQLKASPELVSLALCDRATDRQQKQHWDQVVSHLLEAGIVTHRRVIGELRIWEGSDFNIEKEVEDRVKQEQSSLESLLSQFCPLKPLVAQRHSYKTGTLRYFERRYLDTTTNLEQLTCHGSDADGLVGYWTEREVPETVPPQTADGRPLVIVAATKLDMLQVSIQEYAALRQIETNAPQLQSDGVARLEVRQRLNHARRLVDDSLSRAFDVANCLCWIQGQQQQLSHTTALNGALSDLCDQVYSQGIILWNELINRRELTSQGAKARRELIEAMLERVDQERLGLKGFGPEVSMYCSVLSQTGIHCQEGDQWIISPPKPTSGIAPLWQTIQSFCWNAREDQRSLDLLYQQLEAPPFGIKRGVIPVILAAVLLNHMDDISIYKDGTFIPVLGPEHFELLVKDPSRFSVKYFEIAGLRAQVFQELEDVLRSKKPAQSRIRNLTLLSVVKPLFQFVKKLPACTKKTKRLSEEAQAVLQILLQAQEPDQLLFVSLPQACGMEPIVAGEVDDGTVARTFRKKLFQALHEIQTYYENLLGQCQELLYDAFGIRSEATKLREDLRVRANYLVGQCVESVLRRFTLAAIDEIAGDREWLEALLMIVADKPAESWSDEDVSSFEVKLGDVARRFSNLEALQKEVASTRKEGFEARRITITRPDGEEAHQMVWLDHGLREKVDRLADDILDKHEDPKLRQALAAILTERILGSQDKEGTVQFPSKQRGPHEQKDQTYPRTVRRKG